MIRIQNKSTSTYFTLGGILTPGGEILVKNEIGLDLLKSYPNDLIKIEASNDDEPPKKRRRKNQNSEES